MVDLSIDVTEAAALGEPVQIAVTVHLPDPAELSSPPVVCFAKAGAGLSRGYWTVDLPGPGSGAESDWHATRGWIFVAVDNLGAGESVFDDLTRLDFTNVPAAAHAAEQVVLDRLCRGDLDPGFPPVTDPVVIGIGQSMGACLTVVQQAHHRTYDGIGVLGYAVLHLETQSPRGGHLGMQWRTRDTELPMTEPSMPPEGVDLVGELAYGFYFDDVDVSTVRHFDPTAPWGSPTIPGLIARVTTPGAIAPEAASVAVPVLLAFGQRDVAVDPRREVGAYLSSGSVDLFVCPSMGHMHNFASTRTLFWERIHTWADWVAARRAATS